MSDRQGCRCRFRRRERSKTAQWLHRVGAFGAPWFLAAFLSCGDGAPSAPTGPTPAPPATPSPPTPTGVTLTVDPPTVRENAGATTLTVTAMLTGGTRAAETPISLTVQGGTATSADYAATGATLTIAAGQSSGTATLTMTPVSDNIDEPDESVLVHGTTSVPGLTVTPATLTIADTDVASTSVMLESAPSAVREDAGPTTLTVTATLNAAARMEPIAIDLTMSDGTATGADYAATAATLTIGAGAVTGTAELVLTPVNDDLEEADETVLVNGTALSSGLVVAPATITIRNRRVGAADITLMVMPVAVEEGGGTTRLTVTATLEAGARGDATEVELTVSDGTATRDDYTATGAKLTIGAGTVTGTATVMLAPIEDSRLEGVETVVVRGSAGGLTVAEVEVAVVDPPVEVFFATAQLDIREGETRDLVVRYQVADLPAPWNLELSFVPGTASEADFRTAGTAVQIPSGRIVAGDIAVPLTAVSDLLFSEREETLTVGFVPPSGQGAPRTKLGGDLVITIAEAARSACPGVAFEGSRPRRESGGVLETTLSLEVPRNLGGVGFDWVGPYYDDEDDPENRWTYPLLEVNVADWRMESTTTMTRHWFDIQWPRFLEASLRFYTEDGACDLPALVCDVSGCNERP